ncbi:MAG: hypothetical protein FI729_05555 [SAR202 cluster bacterium]|nr:hypothetical protein [SAR202 cluster bacterium]|tara:strand:+ start:26705 stop:27274 length:570 start_codon:yes stop_codon:yes gene_type:complete
MKPAVITTNHRPIPKLPIRYLRPVLIIVSVLAVFFYIASYAQANGKTATILEITEGDYRIELRSYPTEIRKGNMHFSMVFNYIKDESPAENLSVDVILIGPSPENIFIGQKKLVKDPLYSNWYDFSANLNQEGTWYLEGQIIENEEITNFLMPLEVYPENFNWGIVLVFSSSLPVLISISWYFRKLKRK